MAAGPPKSVHLILRGSVRNGSPFNSWESTVKPTNLNVVGALEEMSGDHPSQLYLTSADHEWLHNVIQIHQIDVKL